MILVLVDVLDSVLVLWQLHCPRLLEKQMHLQISYSVDHNGELILS